jgi:hypothetical protein
MADNLELAARNCEKGFEAFGVTLDQQRSRMRQ